MLVANKNPSIQSATFSKAVTQVQESSANARSNLQTDSSNNNQTPAREESKQAATKFANSSNENDLKFSNRIWKSMGAQFTPSFSPGFGAGFGSGFAGSNIGGTYASGAASIGSTSPAMAANNNNTKATAASSVNSANSPCANGQCQGSSNPGTSGGSNQRLPGQVDYNVSSNTVNDPLYTGATPNNFTIFSACGSREPSRGSNATGEYANFLIHSGITREGKSLNQMLTELNGCQITGELVNSKLRGTSVPTGSVQTAHVTGANLQKEFSAQHPAQNGKAIILMGEPEHNGQSLERSLELTKAWMNKIGIKDIDVVHSEAEFETKIKEAKDKAEKTGQKYDLLAYSVIAHGNVSDHNNNGRHNPNDDGYAYVDPGARYNEADMLGDMQYASSMAENTLALSHTCNSGYLNTDSIAKKEEEQKVPSS